MFALWVPASGSGTPGTSLRGVEPDPASLERPARTGFLSREPSAGDVTTKEVERSLISELAGNVSSQRLQELEAALRPMYAALPKGDAGYLGHQAVRYALHRLLLQRHGWFVVGLEPTDEVLPPYLHGEWVPEYLQGLLEQRLGNRGIDLHESAALAASLEDLVAAEAARRVDLVYELLKVPAAARLSSGDADRILETYMMMYLDGGNFTAPGMNLDLERAVFKAEYNNWEAASAWLLQIKGHHLGNNSDGKLGRNDMVSIVDDLGERFGAFNDGECRSLKTELVELEGARPGRVSVLDFYKKGLYSHWEFNERVDYLRAIGALDETDERHPSVILPNYLAAMTNCLKASRLYSVCCRNECEDLMGHLERELATPTAAPERILALVSELASDTVNASRVLPEPLVQRLHQIAVRHGGQVPLHGRLFAQWMHHAYPRECPFPHEGGVNPLTPDEWMQEAGLQGEARITEDEVRQILGSCANSGADGLPCHAGSSTAESAELPWSDMEVLLTNKPSREAAPRPWVVLAKVSLLLALLPLTGLCASGQPKSSSALAGGVDPEDLEDTDGELQKPGRVPQRLQQFKVLLVLVVVGGLLEALGLLDRFSFGCTLVGGLLLNLALPFLVRSAPSSSLKPKKACV